MGAAAGRREGINLESILQFVTGADDEPSLGFVKTPSVDFTDLAGSLPTASKYDDEGAGTQELDNNIGGSDLELSELDSDSDDDIPLADIIPLAGLVDRGGGDAGHAHNDRRWTADLKPIRVKDFEDIAGPTTALDAEKKELDFFHLIFPESLYDKLAQQTNTYAAKRIREKADSSWQATSPTEIKTFLGIVIFMSLLDLP
ncbi:uncharacterized protein LOC117319772, partial [Pecten maximus]|uniref:uncharacterized protein LOC117319772 n=1 Tax=Pecten maximus TaxID=6579 RepID=UPI00145834AE